MSVTLHLDLDHTDDLDRADSDRAVDMTRRVLDIVLASVLLLVALPVIVLAAVGSAVSLRAWPIFTQDRVGRDGETFRFIKIRTLPTSVPRYLDKHALADHRTPAFCQLLRLLHLDELPQLLLVITGRMGLVGPRPEMPSLHADLDPAFARLRTSVRPGCTGLWQVSDDCVHLIGERPQHDAYYVAHRSVRLDLWILARTAVKMVGGPTVELGAVPSWVRRDRSRRHEVQTRMVHLDTGGSVSEPDERDRQHDHELAPALR